MDQATSRRMPFTGLAPASMEITEIEHGLSIKLSKGGTEITVQESPEGVIAVTLVSGTATHHGKPFMVVRPATTRQGDHDGA